MPLREEQHQEEQRSGTKRVTDIIEPAVVSQGKGLYNSLVKNKTEYSTMKQSLVCHPLALISLQLKRKIDLNAFFFYVGSLILFAVVLWVSCFYWNKRFESNMPSTIMSYCARQEVRDIFMSFYCVALRCHCFLLVNINSRYHFVLPKCVFIVNAASFLLAP